MQSIRVKDGPDALLIERDENGVPRIWAPDWETGWWGLGYMHAIDRGTQMFFSRSVASGRGAEEIAASDELLETDRFFRRWNLSEGIDEECQKVPAPFARELDAYCDGVNKGLAANGRTWPVWATGYRPSPWNRGAVLLVGQLLSFGGLAVSQLENERLLLELIQEDRVDDERLRELFAPMLDRADLSLLRTIRMARKLSDEALDLLTDLPRLAGSNAWALGSQKSASGFPLLASDPHLEMNRLPAIWYEASMQCGDEWVAGATLPGCPLFSVARNRRLAWGVTYLKSDTVDFFMEDCRAGGETGWQYRREETWHDFRRREEKIEVKHGKSQDVTVYENDQGILEADPDEPGIYLSMAWTGKAPGFWRAIATWMELPRTKTVDAARSVVRDCPQPSLCFVLADREGSIGMQTCGRFPIRAAGDTGMIPTPAWDPARHWKGIDPASMNPGVTNPDCGYVATANEAIDDPAGRLLCTQILPDYRKRRLDQVLANRATFDLDAMEDLQYDVLSVQAQDLLPVFLEALPESELKNRLAAWDCQYAPESRGAALFQTLYRHVAVEIFGNDESGLGRLRMTALASRIAFSQMVATAVDRTLLKRESSWWRDRDKGEMIRAAAERAAKEPNRTWGEINYFQFIDRYFGGFSVAQLLGTRSPRYGMPGCFATVFQGYVLLSTRRESTFAPSYHFVADLGTDEARTNLPGGPSENLFSQLYKNDAERWLTGEYKRLAPFDDPCPLIWE